MISEQLQSHHQGQQKPLLLSQVLHSGMMMATSFIVVTTASALHYYYHQHFPSSTAKCSSADHDETHHHHKKNNMEKNFRIEVDLMDKIARRPYLHPFNSKSSLYYRGDDEYDNDHEIEAGNVDCADKNRNMEHGVVVNDDELSITTTTRPLGVPHTLRILALDVPEIKHAFSGGPCFASRRHVYTSGVASPKRCFATARKIRSFSTPEFGTDDFVEDLKINQPPVDENNNNHVVATSSATIDYGKTSSRATTGTTLSSSPAPATEPTKLVRINYRVEQKSVVKDMLNCYNPKSKQISVQVMLGSIAQLNPKGIHPSQRRRRRRTNNKGSSNTQNEEYDDVGKVYSQIHDELDAPWHQHAWMDELELRIGGRVRFGEPMHRTSSFSRLLLRRRRNVFQSTIANSQSLLDPFLFPSLQTDPAGMDGKDWLNDDDNDENHDPTRSSNWASQKPHAVIANGAALRQVPGSLHLLQRLCCQEQVPLFIYQDVHSWRGCHAYNDFNELLVSLRQTIQQHVVRKALRCHQHGVAFASGRLLGQVEGEMAAQIREHKRRLRRAATLEARNAEIMDWSNADASELETRLRAHKVIQTKWDLMPFAYMFTKDYSPAMVELCQQCVSNQGKQPKRPTQRGN